MSDIYTAVFLDETLIYFSLHCQLFHIQVFKLERDRDDKFLSQDDLDQILDEKHCSAKKVREGIIGYPTHPLYRQIACMLQVWMETK